MVAIVAAAPAARAADPPAQDRASGRAPTEAAGVWEREALSGDWGGLRSAWRDRGADFAFNYIGEVLGNVRGGERRLAIYQGRLEMSLDLDLAKAFGWQGAAVHATGYQIHGRGLSANALGNLLTVSGIEARRSTRLFTLWFEQYLFDKRLALRIGQLVADDEFASSTASAFVISSFGWPGILATNLPSGGPAYPLATPGARLRLQPVETFSLQAAVFSGDPAGAGAQRDPERRNASGTTFSFSGGVFVIGEAAFSSGDAGWLLGQPGSLKTGVWYHSACFDDQRFDTAGRSLADPASTGVARRHCGNFGGYAVLDHVLWRVPGSKERGLNAFLRFGANRSDRNLIGWYLDLGATFKGPIPARAEDTAGIAFAFARIGDRARALDRDTAALAGNGRPVRDYEAALEFTYQAQLAPWWTAQPILQLILHPGGNVPNPRSASGAVIRDALVLGLRTTIKF